MGSGFWKSLLRELLRAEYAEVSALTLSFVVLYQRVVDVEVLLRERCLAVGTRGDRHVGCDKSGFMVWEYRSIYLNSINSAQTADYTTLSPHVWQVAKRPICGVS